MKVIPVEVMREIAGFARELVKAGLDETRAMDAAYLIVMMLHSPAMNRLNRKPSALGARNRAACIDACVTLMEHARRKK